MAKIWSTDEFKTHLHSPLLAQEFGNADKHHLADSKDIHESGSTYNLPII